MSYEPSTYTGAPDECSLHWPEKLPCKTCAAIGRETLMNQVTQHPTDRFENLYDFVAFDGFDFSLYRKGELELLQPQLEAIGYYDIEWLPGETDSFGPLSRVCKAKILKDGKIEIVWFMYG